jgi:hypothetical protein
LLISKKVCGERTVARSIKMIDVKAIPEFSASTLASVFVNAFELGASFESLGFGYFYGLCWALHFACSAKNALWLVHWVRLLL